MTTTLKKSESLDNLKLSMSRLDEIAGNSSITMSEGNPFTLAITMATAIGEIRSSLTDDVMKEVILPLMNTKLGFRTDKDPSRPAWNRKANRMEAPEPYPISTVRECLIEATLRGLPPVGNCWNIISAQSYVTKEGFWFLIGKRIPGLTDFKIQIGVPKMIKPAGDARNASDEEAKGALVTCSASWKLNGVADQLEREIPIRVNAMMGADAIMGKSERKLLAAAYAQITGTALGDADATEVESTDFRNVTQPAKGNVASSNPLASKGSTVEVESVEESKEPTSQPHTKSAPTTKSEAPKARTFVDEKDERASLSFDIRETIKEAEITLPVFEEMARAAGFMAEEEALSGGKLSTEKLRIVHEKRRVIAGLDQPEKNQTGSQEGGEPW